MRRLQTLQPELEFASSIQEKDAACVPYLDNGKRMKKASVLLNLWFPAIVLFPSRTALAGSIQEQLQELHAEIADLAAAEAAEE